MKTKSKVKKSIHFWWIALLIGRVGILKTSPNEECAQNSPLLSFNPNRRKLITRIIK